MKAFSYRQSQAEVVYTHQGCGGRAVSADGQTSQEKGSRSSRHMTESAMIILDFGTSHLDAAACYSCAVIVSSTARQLAD